MSQYYLVHHGIGGQKWGVRKGPPYPLDASSHTSSEKKEGNKGWTKEAKKESKDDSSTGKDKEKFHLTDKQKKILKIGLVTTGIALTAVGGYALYKSRAARNLASVGENVINNIYETGDKLSFDIIKNDLLENGYKASDNKSKIDDFFDINYYDKEGIFGSDTNCVSCATSNALSLLGIKSNAKLNVVEGNNFTIDISKNRSISELALAFKGTKVEKPQNINNISEVRKELAKHGDGAVGLFRYVTPNGNGHAVTWSVENGIVKISDSQPANDALKKAIKLKMNPDTAKQLIYERLSNISDDHYAAVDFTDNFMYIRIDNATGVSKQILDSLINK